MKTTNEVNSKTQGARTRGLAVKSGVKAGGHPWGSWRTGGDWMVNHNETQMKARTRGLNVKTGIKAGPEDPPCPDCPIIANSGADRVRR